jgi:hypothetical protein
MKPRAKSNLDKADPAVLEALHRAGKNALELGLRTGTPVWVLENRKMIDATLSLRKNAPLRQSKQKKG